MRHRNWIAFLSFLIVLAILFVLWPGRRKEPLNNTPLEIPVSAELLPVLEKTVLALQTDCKSGQRPRLEKRFALTLPERLQAKELQGSDPVETWIDFLLEHHQEIAWDKFNAVTFDRASSLFDVRLPISGGEKPVVITLVRNPIDKQFRIQDISLVQ